METQSYANHRHNPKLSFIGFPFLLLAIMAFALRSFNIGGRYAMAAGLLALIASIHVLLSISADMLIGQVGGLAVGGVGVLLIWAALIVAWGGPSEAAQHL